MKDIPIGLLDFSPFEPRESIESLETEGDILEPLVVRPKGNRYEVVAGHRRLETLRLRGAKEAPCRVLNLSDQDAALALFTENRDRRDFTDYERGLYFRRFMDRFQLSEREAAAKLRISDTTISLCLGVVDARSRLLRPLSAGTPELYARAMTATKYAQVNGLDEKEQPEALRAVVENRLSTDETKTLAAKVDAGKTVEMATNEILLRRETRKPEAFAERKRRVECPECGGRGYLLKGEPK